MHEHSAGFVLFVVHVVQFPCFASPFVTPSIHKIASTKKAGVTRNIRL